MKITQIDIQNFRAFYGSHTLNLNDGKNLIIYGENGSGKSSLFLALKRFVLSSTQPEPIAPYRNIFADQTIPDTLIRFHITHPRNNTITTHEWSTSNPQGHHQPTIQQAALTSGFLDYRSLLETHFLTPTNNRVNIFPLIINTLFADLKNESSGNTFAQDWKNIISRMEQRHTEKLNQEITDWVDKLNVGLKDKLLELNGKLIDIFGRFGYTNVVQLTLDFPGLVFNSSKKIIMRKEIILSVKFFNQVIPKHHQFLNEAKLSAIGLSLYLAALQIIPGLNKPNPNLLRVLVLDDVLIGFDMSNRLPLIKILKDYFSTYQIFLLTHDLEWYEILKTRLDEKIWKPIEIYASREDVEYEIPVIADQKQYLEKAEFYLQNNDYKAAAIYIRTAFESILKSYCDKCGIPIKFKEKAKELSSQDFWVVIKPKLSAQLSDDIEHARTLIMNPLSHARIVNVYPGEIKEAIELIKNLKNELSKLKNP